MVQYDERVLAQALANFLRNQADQMIIRKRFDFLEHICSVNPHPFSAR